MNTTIVGISNFLVVFIPAFFVVLIVFLLLRELMLWYFRINDVADSLDRIASSLEKISGTGQDQIFIEPTTANQKISEEPDPRLVAGEKNNQ